MVDVWKSGSQSGETDINLATLQLPRINIYIQGRVGHQGHSFTILYSLSYLSSQFNGEKHPL